MKLYSSLLFLFLICGCATIPTRTVQRYPNVHIASGQLVKNSKWDGAHHATFKLTQVHRGHFPTNDFAVVNFETNSVPKEGLPQEALLVLQHVFFEDGHIQIPASQSMWLFTRWYKALVILPDIPENRAIIASRSLASLADNPWWKRISRRRAIRVAEQEFTRRGDLPLGWTLQSKAIRSGFGWSVDTYAVRSDGHSIRGGDTTIEVGDDGAIRDYRGGM